MTNCNTLEITHWGRNLMTQKEKGRIDEVMSLSRHTEEAQTIIQW